MEADAQGTVRIAAGFVALWLLLFAIKLALAWQLQPFGDEAFYWLEGRHPSWAYADLPPLTAWLASLGTAVAGVDALGLRWPFLLLGSLLPWQIVDLGRRWFGVEAGWRGGLLALAMPLSAVLGLLALPDVPLLFASLLCLQGLARLRERIGLGGLVLLGAGMVLGALSHYRFALTLLAGAVAMLADAPSRRLLRRGPVWLTVAIGLLAWWPLLQFNLDEGGAGLRFQLLDRHPWSWQHRGLLQPVVQALVVTPLLFGMLLCTWWRAWRQRGALGPPWALVAACAGVPLATFLLLGLFADTERVSFHWPLLGYLPLLAALPAVFARARRLYLATLLTAAAGTVLLLAVLAGSAQRDADFLARRGVHLENLRGWHEVAAAARQAAPAPDALIVADNFMLASQLAFALDRPRGVYSLDHPLNHKHGRALQLQRWGLDEAGLQEHAGRAVVLIVEDSALKPAARPSWYHRLCTLFARVQPRRELHLDRGRKRFVLFDARLPGHDADAACRLPAQAWLDPPPSQIAANEPLVLTGWAFLDGVGLQRVELLVDGTTHGDTQYGLRSPGVQQRWPASTDPSHPRVGLRIELPPGSLSPGRHLLSLRLIGRDGSVREAAFTELRVR